MLNHLYMFCYVCEMTSKDSLTSMPGFGWDYALQWCHNEHDGISNHWRLCCLRNCLFRCRSKKTSKFHVTGLCDGNSPVTGEFPSQRTSNAENVSIWWCHHESSYAASIGPGPGTWCSHVLMHYDMYKCCTWYQLQHISFVAKALMISCAFIIRWDIWYKFTANDVDYLCQKISSSIGSSVSLVITTGAPLTDMA